MTVTTLLPVSITDLRTVLDALLEATARDNYGDERVDLEGTTIDAMRRLGQAMGLDPILVTPEGDRQFYPHKAGPLRQVAKQSRRDMGPGSWMITTEHVNVCSLCNLSDGDPIHKVAMRDA